MDLFQRDMSGWLVAFWLFFIIFLPFLGVFVYWIARPFSLTEKDLERQKKMEEDVEYARASHETDQLFKLEQLKEKGAITQEQYDAKKAKLTSGLGTSGAADAPVPAVGCRCPAAVLE